jgi:hypothetical protein
MENGWGVRDGALVWDKEYHSRARTDPSGRFHLNASGGSSLTIVAAGYPKVVTYLCSSPMLVRVGGPYLDHVESHDIWMGVEKSRKRIGWSFSGGGMRVPESVADLRLAGPAPGLGAQSIELQAATGMVFVPGTGNPPPPPTSGYSRRVTMQRTSCGWLFVRTRDAGIVAVDPAIAIGEDTDGSQYVLMTYRKARPGSIAAAS